MYGQYLPFAHGGADIFRLPAPQQVRIHGGRVQRGRLCGKRQAHDCGSGGRCFVYCHHIAEFDIRGAGFVQQEYADDVLVERRTQEFAFLIFQVQDQVKAVEPGGVILREGEGDVVIPRAASLIIPLRTAGFLIFQIGVIGDARLGAS